MGSRKIKILRKNPTYFPQKRLNIPICQKNSANADQMHPRKEYPGTPRHLTPSGAVLSSWVTMSNVLSAVHQNAQILTTCKYKDSKHSKGLLFLLYNEGFITK